MQKLFFTQTSNGVKKITWIQIASQKYGGRIYGQKVRDAISGSFEVNTIDVKATYLKKKYIKPLEWFWRLVNVKTESDLEIRDDFNTIAVSFFSRSKVKTLALVYHIDFSVFSAPLRVIFYILETLFYAKLKKTDAIVTISQYWQDFFIKKGYNNVHKVYCGFTMEDFTIADQEITDFKSKFALGLKPIIYIGNCQKAKGVVETYQALKELDVTMVTSGKKMVDIPATHLDLSYREYLCLLKVSSVVVTMSKFREGWCMTAHEAMLLKTPVIGSGKGGMKELLDGGRQIVCQDFTTLKEEVEHVLKNPAAAETMGQNGFDYARSFTMERFNKEWVGIATKLLC